MSHSPHNRSKSSLTTPQTVLYLDHTARWSGGEIALARLLPALDRERYTPLVVLAEEGPLVGHLRKSGIEVIVHPLSVRVREVRKDSLRGAALLRQGIVSVTSLLTYARSIARLARERNATFIHCNSLKSDLYGAIAGRMAGGIPVIWHVRDHIDPSYLPAPAVHGFRALARRLPAAVVTNSQSTKERLFPEGDTVRHRPAFVVHDGLTADELSDGAAPESFIAWARTPLRVGIVGRITPWKGQHIFLEAAARLLQSETHQDIRFVVVGSALFGEEEYEHKLRKQSVSFGNRVEFIGFQQDVARVMRELDILVHASVTPEPFGQVVIEGMAQGLPVIATDGGGVREIVQHGENGVLVPMGNTEALASALAALLADPANASRLGRNGHRWVREQFTATQTARKVEAVYETISCATRPRMGR